MYRAYKKSNYFFLPFPAPLAALFPVPFPAPLAFVAIFTS
jgi:hypothetical protein